MTEAPQFLKTREWIVIIIYCGMMLAITLLTQILVTKERPELQFQHVLKKNIIEVSIGGAIEAPGLYEVEKGATIKDLLTLSKPLPSADLSKIKLSTRLAQGRHVKIPHQEMVTVRIEGEVESPVTIKVPKGTKLNELFDVITLTENANQSALLKKRVARDGETIHIPAKKGKNRRKVL